MQQKIFRSIFWIGYLSVIIAAFISMPGDLTKMSFGPETFHIRLDHLLHLLAYFMICMYYLLGLRKGFTIFENSAFPKFILLVMFLATVTEVIQLWVPERTFNVFDLISNITGIGIGVLIIKMVQRHDGSKVRRFDRTIV